MISFGFWAGDDNLGDAAFYSYTAPEPDGLREQPLIGGTWTDTRQRLARDPPARDGAPGRRPAHHAARVPAERV